MSNKPSKQTNTKSQTQTRIQWVPGEGEIGESEVGKGGPIYGD